VALSKVRQFMAEADACVGDSDTTPGVTDVTYTNDALTDSTGDTDVFDDSNIDIGTDPPNTSPFE
jgi:hypothetical protein